MNPYALLPLTGFLVNCVLAAGVLARSPRERANRLFAAVAVAIAYWSVLKFALRLSGDATTAVRLYQLSAFGWCLIPSLYLHFALVFTGGDRGPRAKAILGVTHLIGLAFAVATQFPGVMVKGMVLVPWGYAHVPAVGYRFFSAFLGLTFVVVIAILLRAVLRASGERRTQLGFVLVGMTVPLIGAVGTNMLLPLLGIHVVELGEVSSTVNAALVAWAMARHGLLAVSLERVAETLLGTVGDALLVADQRDRVVLSNEAAAKLLGLTTRELSGMPVGELLSAPSRRHGAGSIHGPVESEEATLQPPGGEPIPVLLSANPVRGEDGRERGMVYVARDIRDIRRMMEQLHELAVTDELTRVHNRRFASDALDEELARARRYRRELSVALLDLDDFKQINDRHGHAMGDRVLKAVAKALAAGTRSSDVVARWGGDEFLVVMPETGAEAADTTCKRILASLANTVVSRLPSAPQVSIGLATLELDAPPRDADELVRRADEALYEAKRGGKGRLKHARG